MELLLCAIRSEMSPVQREGKTYMTDLNDPRVFFAAERTLLAWNRTSLTFMAFGFVIERFGLFVHMLSSGQGQPLQRSASFWIGLAFIVLGAFSASAAVIQYNKVVSSLKPVQIPVNYRTNLGSFTTLLVAALGVVLTLYLFVHGPYF